MATKKEWKKELATLSGTHLQTIDDAIRVLGSWDMFKKEVTPLDDLQKLVMDEKVIRFSTLSNILTKS